jgi:hypothetical protein
MNMKIKFQKPPEPVETLANRCVAHVKNRLGFNLDFQYETLGVVDHFIKVVTDEEAGDSKAPPGDPGRSHLIHLLAPTVGAYFGEVLRHKYPCRWRLFTDDAKDWLMEFEEVVLRFNPAGAAAEAFAQHRIDSWNGSISTAPADAQDLAERLAASPPVLETDFFVLTTRWEVLQIAEDWLRWRYSMMDSAPPDCFTHQDYDRIFDGEYLFCSHKDGLI